MTRYGSQGSLIWDTFTDMFDFLPVAALIDDRIFCTHGGLSPTLQTLNQIKVIPRFQEVPFEGILTDMMWSDPDPEVEGFAVSPRGVGYLFGEDIVTRFLAINDCDMMLRAHQICEAGYNVLFNEQLATIWSAPNYCYRAQNMASILEIADDHSRYFNVFGECPEEFRATRPGKLAPARSARDQSYFE